MLDQFKKYLEQSATLRTQYTESLLPMNTNWKQELNGIMENIPKFLEVIYSTVGGTKYEVSNQSLMDFIPGYLLIHIDEYQKNYNDLKNILINYDIDDDFYPILRNYSSDFIALKKDTHEIYTILHDDTDIELIHENPFDFLLTLNNNYERNVYFLDNEKYLDYDMDKEYQIAREFNPSVEFWIE